MTETINATSNYKADHTVYGGEITIKDFNTTSPSKKRIRNQIESINELNQRKELQKYKHMTLEELKEMRIISNTNGRPSSALTDEKWQKEFAVRKLFVKPYKGKKKNLKGRFSKESGLWNEEVQGGYDGTTNWQQYCAYINDILDTIRDGQVDYCYFIFQIMDLLKFHFYDLRTEYCDGYWKVWLEK